MRCSEIVSGMNLACVPSYYHALSIGTITYWICPFSTASWRAVLFALFRTVKIDVTNFSLQRIWDWKW